MPDVISSGVAFFLAWLFGLAAVHKLRDRQFYAALIGRYLPAGLARPSMVLVVALLEGGTALALLPVVTRGIALALAMLLLLAYAGLMFLQWVRGKADMRCGCAGPASELTVSPALVARNVTCACLALAAVFPVATIAPGWLGAALSLMIAAFLAVGYLCVEQLIGNAQRMTEAR